MKTIILLGTLAVAFSTVYADAQSGKTLHDESCMKCHGTEVYTREDHFVTNTEQLTAQVNRCQMNVGANWSAEQIQDVAQYLDQSYYHFK